MGIFSFGGSTTESVAPVNNAISLDASGLDHESRVMAICSSMLSLLDKRMNEQMKLMETRNQEADQLRGYLQQLNTVLNQFEVGSGPGATVSVKPDNADAQKAGADAQKAGTDAQKTGADAQKTSADAQNALAGAQKALQSSGISELVNLASDGVFRKGDVDLAISSVTGMMDSKTQIQQKDSFTLQSLLGKRNETYELMSNVFKKCQDSKAVISRNI